MFFYKAGFIEHWGRGFDKVKLAFTAADFDITDRQRKILELVEKAPSITAAELAKILKVNPRTIQRDFAKLFEKGILVREGSDKSA